VFKPLRGGVRAIDEGLQALNVPFLFLPGQLQAVSALTAHISVVDISIDPGIGVYPQGRIHYNGYSVEYSLCGMQPASVSSPSGFIGDPDFQALEMLDSRSESLRQ
jgi:hypothetical protein